MRLALVFSLLLCACVASEEPYDDVASQESAVEEAPVPTPVPTEEDMHIRMLYVACYNNCSSQFPGCVLNLCHLVLRDRQPSCEGDCAYAQWQCQANCASLYNTAN